MKQKTFERALHQWRPWTESIDSGRKLLKFRKTRPNVGEMREVAKKVLAGLGFPPCTLFELYWLCCVFADYKTNGGFKFEKIVLPDWFPLPFGFESEDSYDLGKRIYPPEVWSEDDKQFWFDRDPLVRNLPRRRAELWETWPNRDFVVNFVLMLPSDHPVHKFVKRGRPITTGSNGETIPG